MIMYFSMPKDNQLQDWLQAHIAHLQAVLTHTSVQDDQAYMQQALQARIGFYQLLQTTNETTARPDIQLLIDQLENMYTKMHSDREECSYYVLGLLQSRVPNTIDRFEVSRLQKAIEVCSIKIAMMNIEIKLLQMSIANALQVDWLGDNVRTELLRRQEQYCSYASVELRYKDNMFFVRFKVREPKFLALSVLEDLVFIMGEPVPGNGSVEAVEILAHAMVARDKFGSNSLSELGAYAVRHGRISKLR